MSRATEGSAQALDTGHFILLPSWILPYASRATCDAAEVAIGAVLAGTEESTDHRPAADRRPRSCVMNHVRKGGGYPFPITLGGELSKYRGAIVQRFPKLTATRENDAYRHLHLLQRAGLAPFAVAWIYDQVGCRFVLLVVAMPQGHGTMDETGRYKAAVQSVLGQGRDAPGHILAIDDRHPCSAALRKAITLLRQPRRGALHALKLGNFVLVPAWIYHTHVGRLAAPPKWRWERVEHALAA